MCTLRIFKGALAVSAALLSSAAARGGELGYQPDIIVAAPAQTLAFGVGYYSPYSGSEFTLPPSPVGHFYDVYIRGNGGELLYNRPCTVANGTYRYPVSCEALFRAGFVPGYDGWRVAVPEYAAARITVRPRVIPFEYPHAVRMHPWCRCRY